MARRIGSPKVPETAKALVPKGERVLAWGRDAYGEVAMATTVALYLPGRTGDLERVPFESVASATWEDPDLVVTLVGGRGRRLHAILEEAGDLPATVRERVTSTIALSEHVTLAGGAGALITARRSPGAGAVSWNVVFDAGLDPRDPELQARADAAISDLRVATGL